MKDAPRVQEQAERERYEALVQREGWLETPALILGIGWLILLVIELIWGLTPFFNTLVYLRWGVLFSILLSALCWLRARLRTCGTAGT